MVSLKPKNPLILIFLLSFLLNNPYVHTNGPTYDMYNCLKHIINVDNINSDVKYNVDKLKIVIPFGSSKTNVLIKNLYYFPSDVECEFRLIPTDYPDNFTFNIVNNILIVKRIDFIGAGWDHNHSVELIINAKQCIYLFREILLTNDIGDSFIVKNSKKIFDSRDRDYCRCNGWK
jgi:hypothetical protein